MPGTRGQHSTTSRLPQCMNSACTVLRPATALLLLQAASGCCLAGTHVHHPSSEESQNSFIGRACFAAAALASDIV